MLCIHLKNTNPYFCLATEEYLLKNFDEDIFMLWQSDDTLVVGKHQNALAERVNGILKQEFLLHKCRNLEELKSLVRESFAIYNCLRPHLSLNMQTPEEVHKKATSMGEVA